MKPHNAYKPDSPRQHFEHFAPTPKDCRWSVRTKSDTLNRPWVAKPSAVPSAGSGVSPRRNRDSSLRPRPPVGPLSCVLRLQAPCVSVHRELCGRMASRQIQSF